MPRAIQTIIIASLILKKTRSWKFCKKGVENEVTYWCLTFKNIAASGCNVEVNLTPGRGRGWYICWKLQGMVGSTVSLGHISLWGHWKNKTTREKMNKDCHCWMNIWRDVFNQLGFKRTGANTDAGLGSWTVFSCFWRWRNVRHQAASIHRVKSLTRQRVTKCPVGILKCYLIYCIWLPSIKCLWPP